MVQKAQLTYLYSRVTIRRMVKKIGIIQFFFKPELYLTVLLLIVLPALMCLIYTPGIAGAAADEVKWSMVDIPLGGESGGWVLAGGSDIEHITVTSDGTLYCYADPSATSTTLFRSTDSGYHWSPVAGVDDAIIDIAAVPGTDEIYYTTESDVYKSVDGISSFIRLPQAPGGAGTENITISCIDVVRDDGNNIITAGTRDNDTLEYGGVYILDEGEPVSSWLDTNIGNYDVCAIEYSPGFAIDRQLIAVVTDEQDTLIRSRINTGSWGQVHGDAIIENLVTLTASIAFPGDYHATTEDYILFVAVNSASNEGDVYKVYGVGAPDNSAVDDLNTGAAYGFEDISISGLAVTGNTENTSLLAASSNGTVVYRSTDDGITWKRSIKEPTGQSVTGIIMAPGFNENGTAYLTTSGAESAYSVTRDGGITWNQVSMIDTGMSGGILDIAVTPVTSQDDAMFMLTFCGVNTEHSLWRCMEDEERWERVFSSTLDNIDSLNVVEISPEYGNSGEVLYLSGTKNGSPVILKSIDNGQTFHVSNTPNPVDVWSVLSNSTLILGSYNGTAANIYFTVNGGLTFLDGSPVGHQPLASIAISPNYDKDKTILVGNTDGWVYYSTDNGTIFKPLPPDTTSAPLEDSVYVTFDSNFAENSMVYGVSNSADKGVYRYKIGASTGWERLDANLPSGGVLGQVVVSEDGVLYAVNSQSVSAADEEGGMERSLNPTYSLGPTFETVIRGLADDVKLSGLWQRGNQLWSVDTYNTRLMTYIDTLTEKVNLTSPFNEAPGIGIKGLLLNWESLDGATQYEWQIDSDTDFSSVPTDFEGTTAASSVMLPDLNLNTTYYWRVRATQPVLSRWSERWSFDTALGNSIYAPVLLIPKAGDSDISLKPLFQWSALSGAESYELLVSSDAAFSNPVIIRADEYALPATAWKSDVSLDYNTTYYWKVRARGLGSLSDWSSVGIFSTGSEVTEIPPSSESLMSSMAPTSPAMEHQSDSPTVSKTQPEKQSSEIQEVRQFPEDWMLYLGGALLLIIVLLVVTLLVIVTRINRA